MKYKVSVVIPVFNDVDALPELLDRLGRVSCEQGYSMDVVLVDDGSDDKVWFELEGIVEKFCDLDLRVLQLDRNHGQHPATIEGLLVARGDFMVTMDSDLQHPPEFIPVLLDRLRYGGEDLVYATGSCAHSMIRRLIGTARRILAAPIGTSLVKASSFRAISRSLFDSRVRRAASSIINLDEHLSWETRNITSIPAPHHPRKHNASAYTPRRLLAFAFQTAWGTRHLSRAICITGVGLVLIGVSTYIANASSKSYLFSSLSVGIGLFFIFSGLMHRFVWRYRTSNEVHVIKTIKTRSKTCQLLV